MSIGRNILRGVRLGSIVLFGAVIVLTIYAFAATPKTPYTRMEVSAFVDKIHHEAAISSPHFSLGRSVRKEHLKIFEAVESGQPLSMYDSATYRNAYQTILRTNQWYLSLFDSNLTVVLNHAMHDVNNVGGAGIAGAHDHHDYSAASNLASLRTSLAKLEESSSGASHVNGIFNAIRVYKDLTDILLHMATAPQTKSTPYRPSEVSDELDRRFDRLMRAYKSAQFEPVNSPAFLRQVHVALGAYDDLVLHVQARVTARLSPWQRVMAGRWLGWQSFGPDLSDATAGPVGRKQQSL